MALVRRPTSAPPLWVALRCWAGFVPLLIGLIVAEVVPIIMLGTIIFRHAERRAPAAVLLAGCIISFAISSLKVVQSLTAPTAAGLTESSSAAGFVASSGALVGS
jgi:hypothetical protein